MGFKEQLLKKGAKAAEMTESTAAKILKKIDTPEKAVKLTGAEREEYLKALDTTFGPKSERGFYNPSEGYVSTRLSQMPEKHPSENVQKLWENPNRTFGQEGTPTPAYVNSEGQVRAASAAFDPRFKNSGLIMAMDAQKNAPKRLMESIGEAASALSIPQRIAMKKLAESIGAKGSDESSEESAYQIVDRAAKKMGLPENSEAINAAKGAAVAALEVFADPVGLVPVGKISKMVKGSKMKKGALIAEAALAEGEKIAQKVGSGAEKAIDLLQYKSKYVPNIKIDKVHPSKFFEAVEAARNSSDMHKLNITSYKPEEYAKMETFLSPDGRSGYAIKIRPDGKREAVSLFSTERGRGKDLMADATINRGAQTLDAYDIKGKLPDLYNTLYTEKKRDKFVKEFAPEGWDPAKHGTPDIVYMDVDPEKVSKFMEQHKATETVAPTLKKWSQAE